MVIKTEELTIIDNNIPEYCVTISDTVDGWHKQVGPSSRCEQDCISKAEWIRSLFSKRELKRYSVSVVPCHN